MTRKLRARLWDASQGLAGMLPEGLARRLSGPTILFFHGVEPHLADPRVQTVHHELTALERALRTLKRSCVFLSFRDLPEALAHPERFKDAVFLSSDDGYRNLFTHAADLLARLDIPATVFLSTHHIDSGKPNPTFVARLFAHSADRGDYSLPVSGGLVSLTDDAGSRITAAARLVEGVKYLPYPAAKALLLAMHEAMGADRLSALAASFESEAFLSWKEVRALSAAGWGVGAHAHHHLPMHAGDTIDHLRAEAITARDRIQAEVGAVEHFAYPFGGRADVCRSAVVAVAEAGFRFGHTAVPGSLTPGLQPLLLPRLGLPLSSAAPAAAIPLLGVATALRASWRRELTA